MAPCALSLFARVHALVRRIPRGRVATYGQLSQLLDGRLSPVAVGWAMHAAGARALPWHRVVNARGGVSYQDPAIPGLQRRLLEAEGVRFDARDRVDLAVYAWRPRRARRREVAP